MVVVLETALVGLVVAVSGECLAKDVGVSDVSRLFRLLEVCELFEVMIYLQVSVAAYRRDGDQVEDMGWAINSSVLRTPLHLSTHSVSEIACQRQAQYRGSLDGQLRSCWRSRSLSVAHWGNLNNDDSHEDTKGLDEPLTNIHPPWTELLVPTFTAS